MKKTTIIFWASTSLLALMMVFSAYSYLANPDMKAAFVHLGFPDYFRIELAVVKVLGAIALVLPMVPKTIKEMTYFGFAITFISASIAHFATGDPQAIVIMPLVFLGLLAVSYFTRKSQPQLVPSV